MNLKNRFYSLLLCSTFATVTTLSGFAAMQSGTGTDTADPTSISAADLDCDTFCEDIITGTGNVTDLTCANHDLPTNGNVHKDSTVTLIKDSTCPVSYISGETCDEASNIRRYCLYKNSQILSHCESYQAAQDATTGDWIMWGLDVATAGTCATACLSQAAGSEVSQKACEIAGTAAGATELAIVLSQETSTTGKMIGTIAAGVGLGTSAYSWFGGKSCPGTLAKGAAADSKTCKQKMACTAAIAYGIMAGVRTAAIIDQNSTKDEACKNVKSLVSSTTVLDTTGVTPTPTATPTPAPTTSPSSSPSSSPNNSITYAHSSTSITQGGLQSTDFGRSSAAKVGKDATGLIQSGLDRQVAPKLDQLDAKRLQTALSSGTPSGALLKSAAKSMGYPSSSFLDGIAQISDNAASESRDLAPTLNLAKAIASSPTKATPTGAPGGLDFTYNKDAVNAAKNAPPGATQFGTPGQPEDNDVFHSKSNKSIFQIISDKLKKVANRILGTK